MKFAAWIPWIPWILIVFGFLLGLAFVTSPLYLFGGLAGWVGGVTPPVPREDPMARAFDMIFSSFDMIFFSLTSFVVGLLLIASCVKGFLAGLIMKLLLGTRSERTSNGSAEPSGKPKPPMTRVSKS